MNNINKKYEMAKRTPFFGLLASLLLSTSIASAKEIRGQVTDAATGKPLQGVSIEAYGNSKFAAITDVNGRYFISALTVFVFILCLLGYNALNPI